MEHREAYRALRKAVIALDNVSVELRKAQSRHDVLEGLRTVDERVQSVLDSIREWREEYSGS